MGKFIYRDDKGQDHEIKIQNISSKGIMKGDVVLAHYEVGNAPSSDVPAALEKLRDLLQTNLPEGIHVLVAATRHGVEDVKLKILKDKTARKALKEAEDA